MFSHIFGNTHVTSIFNLAMVGGEVVGLICTLTDAIPATNIASARKPSQNYPVVSNIFIFNSTWGNDTI